MLVPRYFEDLPEDEIARIMGCSLGTVRSTETLPSTRTGFAVVDAKTGQITFRVANPVPVLSNGSDGGI
ncbi:sigma factor-like helix-turn-helix DNA-binding protein [Acrocarpospora sp. B8E8]